MIFPLPSFFKHGIAAVILPQNLTIGYSELVPGIQTADQFW